MTARDQLADRIVLILDPDALDPVAQEQALAVADDVLGMIKPLEWHRSTFMAWNGDYHTIPTGYTIRCADENGWKWSHAGGFGYKYSPETAKAAANAHHRAQILAAIGLHEIPE